MINELEFQDQVVEFANLFRWRVAHFRGDLRDHCQYQAEGFVDLVLAHPNHGTFFAECKSDDKRRQPAERQQEWLLVLDGFLWRPKHQHCIEAFLRTGKPRHVEHLRWRKMSVETREARSERLKQ